MTDTAVLVHDYFDDATFARIKSFADTHETPFLVVDLATINRQYDDLTRYFPTREDLLRGESQPGARSTDADQGQGASFDIASTYELDKVLALGVSPDRISFGNTIKKAKDIRNFYQKGVRMFATDSEADLRNIAKAAPGSRIYARILTEGTMTADWPLSRKFGCESDMAMDLLILARDLGLEPYGVSFHVGSQQREIGAWDAAIAKVKVIFKRLREEDGIS